MTSWKVLNALSTQPPLDREEKTTQADDDRVWFSLSESHTPSQLFVETLSRDPSMPFSPETPPMDLSTKQPLITTETKSNRAQPLEVVAPPTKPHIATAKLLDHDSDDVIAVPVRSAATG